MKNGVLGWDLISSLAFQPPQRTNKAQYNPSNAAKLRMEYVQLDVTQIHHHHFTAPTNLSSTAPPLSPAAGSVSGASSNNNTSLETAAAQIIRNYLTRDRNSSQSSSTAANSHATNIANTTTAIPMGTIGTGGATTNINTEGSPKVSDGVVKISYVRFLPKGTLPGTPISSPMFRGTPMGRGNGVSTTPLAATPTMNGMARPEGERRSPVPAAVFTTARTPSQINTPLVGTPTITRGSVSRGPLNSSSTPVSNASGSGTPTALHGSTTASSTSGLQIMLPPTAPIGSNSNLIGASVTARQHLQNEAIDKWTGGVILYAHGAGEDIPSSYSYFESLATETQCLVVAFDYLGYGYSTGLKDDCTEANAYLAMETVFNHLVRRLRIETRRIVLMGRSLGSGPVVELAHREAVRNAGLAGVILISPMYSAASVVKYGSYVPSFLDIFNNHNKITAINTCPILIIHGDRDEVIPYWHAEKLYDIAYNARRSEQNQRLGIPTGIIARSIKRFLPVLSKQSASTPNSANNSTAGASPNSFGAKSSVEDDEVEELLEEEEEEEMYHSCEDSPKSHPTSGRNSAPQSTRSRGASRGPTQSPRESAQPKNSEKNRFLLSASGAKPIPPEKLRKSSKTVSPLSNATGSSANDLEAGGASIGASRSNSAVNSTPQSPSGKPRNNHSDPMEAVPKKKERFAFVKDLIKSYKDNSKKESDPKHDSDDDTNFYEATPSSTARAKLSKQNKATVRKNASQGTGDDSLVTTFSSGGSQSTYSAPTDMNTKVAIPSSRPVPTNTNTTTTSVTSPTTASGYCGGGFGSVSLPPKFSPPSAVVLLTVEGCGHHDLEFRRGRHLYAQINHFLSEFCGQQSGGGVGGARTLMALSAGLSAANAFQHGVTPTSGNSTPGANNYTFTSSSLNRHSASTDQLSSPTDPTATAHAATNTITSGPNSLRSFVPANASSSSTAQLREDSSGNTRGSLNSGGRVTNTLSNTVSAGGTTPVQDHLRASIPYDSMPSSPETSVQGGGTPVGSLGSYTSQPLSRASYPTGGNPQTFSNNSSVNGTPKTSGLSIPTTQNVVGGVAFPTGYVPYKGGAAAVGNASRNLSLSIITNHNSSSNPNLYYLGEGNNSGTNTPINQSVAVATSLTPQTPQGSAPNTYGRYSGPLAPK